MTHLKTPDNIFETDFVGNAFLKMDWQYVTLSDYYKKVKKIKLSSECPQNIIQHFDDARNLYLYSYFYYRFGMIARRELITTLELALKERLNMVRPATRTTGLKELISQIISYKIINKDNLRLIRPNLKSISEFRKLMTNFRTMRNELSHGSDVLFPMMMQDFADIRNIINLLFNKSTQVLNTEQGKVNEVRAA